MALALPLVIGSGSVPLRILCHRLKVPFPGLALPSVLLVASGCVALIALAISLGWEQLPGNRRAHLDGYFSFPGRSHWNVDESDAVVVHLAGTAALGAMLVVAASAIAYWIRVRHREDEIEGGT